MTRDEHPSPAGNTRLSGRLLVGLVLLYVAVGINWRHLLDPSKGMDWLLLGIWVTMTALVVWGLSPRQDLRLAVVALLGGTVIEWWGTHTELWRYFTRERPPLWILPAWPIAALAIDHLTRLALRLLPPLGRLGGLYWLLMPAFIAAMTRFLWPSAGTFASQVVIVLMIAVMLSAGRRRAIQDRDVALFLVGAIAGIFLEYWGTTRFCWTYYTRQKPPIEAILAHGFASVAFARAADAVAWLGGRATLPPTSSPQRDTSPTASPASTS